MRMFACFHGAFFVASVAGPWEYYGPQKERGAGETREVRGSSLSPLTFLHSLLVFLRLLCRPSFFVPLILLKKTSCGIRCLYFESTIHSFIFDESQHVQRFEKFIHMKIRERNFTFKPGSYLVKTCHILRPVNTYNFFWHFPAQVLLQVWTGGVF